MQGQQEDFEQQLHNEQVIGQIFKKLVIENIGSYRICFNNSCKRIFRITQESQHINHSVIQLSTAIERMSVNKNVSSQEREKIISALSEMQRSIVMKIEGNTRFTFQANQFLIKIICAQFNLVMQSFDPTTAKRAQKDLCCDLQIQNQKTIIEKKSDVLRKIFLSYEINLQEPAQLLIKFQMLKKQFVAMLQRKRADLKKFFNQIFQQRISIVQKQKFTSTGLQINYLQKYNDSIGHEQISKKLENQKINKFHMAFCQNLTQNFIHTMTSLLKKHSELQVLILQNCINFDSFSLYQIVKHCNNLKIFDIGRSLILFNRNRTIGQKFDIKTLQIRQQSLPFQDCKKIVIWISDIDNYLMPSVLKQCSQKKLKHLKLGNATKDKKISKISKQSVKAVGQLQHLRSFCCQNVNFNSQRYLRLNNEMIQEISIISCYGLDQGFYDTILLRKSLKVLEIKNDYLLQQFPASLTNLQYLSLEKCNKVDSKSFIKMVNRNRGLQSVEVASNEWFNNEVFKEIQPSKNIRLLNIQQTSITSEGLENLTKFIMLQTLICGKNDIKCNILASELSNSQYLTRLSIQKLNGKEGAVLRNAQLVKLAQKLNQLTHLNINDCTGVGGQSIIQFKKIKVIDCKNVLIAKKHYQIIQNKMGVKLNQ